jgi:hypothetical protein
MDPQLLKDNQQPQILAIVIVFPILAFITVILRLYTRLIVIKNAASEDYCIAFAMVSLTSCYEEKF